MKSIDPKGLAGYNSGVEKGRLHRGLGLIEFARTKEILLEELPPPPAVIYDIGGAYGEYAKTIYAKPEDKTNFKIDYNPAAQGAYSFKLKKIQI